MKGDIVPREDICREIDDWQRQMIESGEVIMD